jgi:demethylspheroidene O-methyltransferase
MSTGKAFAVPPLPTTEGWWSRLKHRIEEHLAQPSMYDWGRARWWTRWAVRRRTERLFAWMGGFVHSQVLLACLQLRLFDALKAQPQSAEHLSQTLQVPLHAMRPLLQSACAMDLLAERGDGHYGLGPLGHVVRAHPGIAAMIEHNHLLYRDMAEPVRFLRESNAGQMAAYWPYAQDQGAAPALRQEAAQQLGTYSALMDASQTFVVTEILDSYYFGDHRCVLDVGCGKGRFMAALATQVPHLQVKLFDLPAVLSLAQQRFEQAQLQTRATFHPGSFLDDELPSGADLITLVRVAHDHSDQALRLLLRKIWQALPVGGRVLLAEPMQLPNDEAAVVDPYFHFYLLAMGAGRLRSAHELMHLLQTSGFTGVESVPTAMPIHTQIITGHKTSVYPN